MQERKYQLECEDAIVSNFDNNVRRQLVNMATGTGKTVVFSKLYERLKSRLPGQQLVLAHREELIKQALDKLRLVNPSLKIDEERAEVHADTSNADIVVASVATLGRKGTPRLEKYDRDKFDKFIVDEAHHSPADSYGNIFDHFGLRGDNLQKLLLGVTATPGRGDGKALAETYQKIVYVYSIRQAIEDGWLVDIRGYRIRTQANLSEVHKSGGDFAQDELSDAVNTPVRNALIVRQWKRLGENRQTVAFTVDIAHAKALAGAFEAEGVVAAAVWGDDPDRALKLKMHREGKIKVLCNCGVLVEGYDDWRISCVIIARPTMSGILYTQMVGRGTRLQEGLGNLKTLMGTPEWLATIKKDLIVLDMVDDFGKHSLVTLPTLMGLQGILDLKGGSLMSAVHALEAAQLVAPSGDFTNLDDIDKLKAMVDSINLFEVKFPPEVEENSDLIWFKAANGGYRMNVPKNKAVANSSAGHVRIYQNLLNKWEIEGTIEGNQFHGIRGSMEEAFKVSDEQVRELAKGVLTLLRRKATWNADPATAAQFLLLKKFFPWKSFPDTLTKGQASKLISEKLAGKAKK